MEESSSLPFLHSKIHESLVNSPSWEMTISLDQTDLNLNRRKLIEYRDSGKLVGMGRKDSHVEFAAGIRLIDMDFVLDIGRRNGYAREIEKMLDSSRRDTRYLGQKSADISKNLGVPVYLVLALKKLKEQEGKLASFLR